MSRAHIAIKDMSLVIERTKKKYNGNIELDL